VSVDQLEQLLVAAERKPDAKLAQQLSELELSERLSGPRFGRLEAALPGRNSRQALVVLADMSAFLNPPAAEIPQTAVPSLAAQSQWMGLTVQYAEKMISRLPNFFATRDTIRFEDNPQTYRADMSVIPAQPLHAVGRLSETVLYRDGREQVDTLSTKDKKPEVATQGLSTSGVFGSILGRVLVDAAHSRLVWSHWEQGTAGPLAVFRYGVPKEKSHYQVEYCCILGADGPYTFHQFSGYHGIIAVNPSTGEVSRLTLEADLKPEDQIVRSDILVEYAPVEIGGKVYICPIKSVSISRAPALPAGGFELQRYRGSLAIVTNQTAPDRMQTLLNDVAFTQYHLFRSEVRVLTAEDGEPTRTPESPAPGSGGVADTPTVASNEVSSMEDHATAAPAESAVLSAPTSAAGDTAISAPPPDLRSSNLSSTAADGEISVQQATGLPGSAASAQPPSDSRFTLRVNTRLVDVGVLAFDKKGRPVGDLQPANFEVYDNGRKQEVRFFSHAGSAPAAETGKAPGSSFFSNRPAPAGHTEVRIGAAEEVVTILLIDAGNMAWPDLTNVRAQMLRFLAALPAGESIGIYVMTVRGFQILEEATADHVLLASKLRAWMPGAQDLARANEAEGRNRQQFDTVRNLTDLEYVNGTIHSAPETVTHVDPKLRDNGSHSGRDRLALPILSAVARHLAAVPGHKNLVWVTSDNVLVDWADKAVSSDKGRKDINGLVLDAQESLNDAHVSVYPLDGSQLETMAVDASLENANIQLAPGVMAPPPAQGGAAKTGRITAEMQQDVRPIEAPMLEMATATGGHVFRRTGDLAASLAEVVAEGRAFYLLSFTPDTPADGQYHLLTVKLAGQRGVTLRYRDGYLYAKAPATLKDRFRQAVQQTLGMNEIAVSARTISSSVGSTLRLNIATADLALKQHDERWTDTLDIFMIRMIQSDDNLQTPITGQSLRLTLKPVTYAKLLQDGIPFDQAIDRKQKSGSVRIIVVDENSGRMGSVTVPAAVLNGKS
jgi:VWFA-related protein